MPTTKPKKPTHGGARAGAGRPPSTGRRGGPQTVIRWSADERKAVADALGDEKAIAGLARGVMLELAPHYDSVSASLYPTETFTDFVAIAVSKELRARNGGSIELRVAILEAGKPPRCEDDDRARPRAPRRKA